MEKINKKSFMRSIKKKIGIKRTPIKSRVKKTTLEVKPLPWQDQQKSIYSNTSKGQKQKKKDEAKLKKLESLSTVEKNKKKRKQKIGKTMTDTLQNASINPQK